uniref:Rho GDP-dissociation inhibitor 3 n=1 Tax=Strigamia maritima TaxID=126957 RepID=T1ITV4_STRMM
MVNMNETVKEVKNSINSTKDSQQIVKALSRLHCYLPGVDSPVSIEEKIDFIQHHYIRFLYFLLENIDSSLENTWNTEQLAIFDDFFLKGSLNDSLIALVSAIGAMKPSFKLEKCVTLIETIIKPKQLSKLFINICKLENNSFVIHECVWNDLINVVISLPERLANKLQMNNRLIFYPEKYFENISAAIVITLKMVADELREEKSCSLQFLSRLYGRCCAIGRADAVLMCLLTRLIRSDDYIWRRMCQKFLLDVPDRHLENMLSSLVKLVPQMKWMSVVLGDAVTINSKLRMLLTKKFLLLRTFNDDKVSWNILGYLNETSVELSISVFKSLLAIWGDKIAVNQTSLSQHIYITKALLICAGLLKRENLSILRDELVVKLMEGVSCHLGSPHENIRILGMVTAECLIHLIDPDAPPLKFEYRDTEETRSLKALIKSDVLTGEIDISYMDEITEQLETLDLENPVELLSKKEDKVEDLDSDDDLEPYDMSNDAPVSKMKKPSYLRDCLEGLIDQNNPDRTEICLQTAEYLIRNERDLSAELATEVVQVLLHLEDNCSITNFLILRQKSLVAALVCSPVKVAIYLTRQFSEPNYSLRQRLDILEVLTAAAQELSEPTNANNSQEMSENSQSPALVPQKIDDWKEIIAKRIASKTKYFHKAKKTPNAIASRFAPVAGYFFFDLMRNFDERRNSFDLLGDDCIVLGRLLHTLGNIMYAAINAPIVPQMARSLLDFILVLRFHPESYIRKSVLFAFCMLILAVPSHMMYQDFQCDFLECIQWLQGLKSKNLKSVVSHDKDQECRYLAGQALILSRNSHVGSPGIRNVLVFQKLFSQFFAAFDDIHRSNIVKRNPSFATELGKEKRELSCHIENRLPIVKVVVSRRCLHREKNLQMSDENEQVVDQVKEEEEEISSYKPPPEKSLQDILAADENDESLRKYKETLLGNATTETIIIVPDDPRKVLVQKLVLVAAGRTDIELDLTGDLTQLKKQEFKIKEGVQYRIRIDFLVQREIVTGLKYVQKTYRKGIQVDKMAHMVGSYAPKQEIQSYLTPLEDAPSGLLARGGYSVKSCFTDDDNTEHLKWEWAFEIKKEWE